MSSKSKTFCILPHTTLAVQNYGDVCACNINKYSYKLNNTVYTVDQGPLEPIWDSPQRQELIQALDNDIPHPSCKSCWDSEAAGKKSARQQYNSALEHLAPFQPSPKILILKPGNTCNAACRICNPATSSSWYADDYKRQKQKNSTLEFKEYIKKFETVKNSFHPDNPNFWPTIKKWLQELEFIDIYGGEPMLIDGLWSTLNYAVESGHSKNIKLNLHTNLSVYNPKYLDILSKFKQVTINFSIDSHIPQHFEYMRYKLSYNECIQNINRFIETLKNHSNINMSITCSVSVLNVWNIDEIVFTLKSKFQIPVSLNFVTMPDLYYDVRHLPSKIKHSLISKYQNNESLVDVVNFLKQIEPGCVIYWPKFCMETDKLDQIRGQSFKTVMPEWYSQLEPYWDYRKSNPEWFS